MSKREKLDPNSQGYTNALLEDMEDKIQAVLEIAAPIPEMQENLKTVLKRMDKTEQRLDAIEQHLSAVEQRVS